MWRVRCRGCGTETIAESSTLRKWGYPICRRCKPVTTPEKLNMYAKAAYIFRITGDATMMNAVRQKYGIKRKSENNKERRDTEYNTAYQFWKRTGDDSKLHKMRAKYGIKAV